MDTAREQPRGGHDLSRRLLRQGQGLGLVQQTHAGLIFQADGVEGAYRQAAQSTLAPQYMLQPLPQLLSGPVGEGNRCNVIGLYTAFFNQMGNPVAGYGSFRCPARRTPPPPGHPPPRPPAESH